MVYSVQTAPLRFRAHMKDVCGDFKFLLSPGKLLKRACLLDYPGSFFLSFHSRFRARKGCTLDPGTVCSFGGGSGDIQLQPWGFSRHSPIFFHLYKSFGWTVLRSVS